MFKNHCRILSLTLAAMIQASPALRLVFTAPRTVNAGYAVVSKWTVGLAALLGSYHAVSGASTVVTSPDTATGKVGEQFSYRITSAPEQGKEFWVTAKAGSTLVPGLSMGTGSRKSFYEGIPQEAGTYFISVTASNPEEKNGTTSKDLTITIQPNGTPPVIDNPPPNQKVDPGGTATFEVIVSGSGPFEYQWKHNGDILDQKNENPLVLNDVQASNQGDYTVVVSNSSGSVESDSATLTLNLPLEMAQPEIINGGFSFAVSGPAGLTVVVEYKDGLSATDWTTLRSFPTGVQPEPVKDTIAAGTDSRFYRIRVVE